MPYCLLTPDEVLEIYRSTQTTKVLAEWYGVSYSTITDIKNRRTWKCVLDNIKKLEASA